MEFKKLLTEAFKAYSDKDFPKALDIYSDCLSHAKELKENRSTICLLKYIICCCQFESNKLDDLAQAVMTLQTLDKDFKARFPALYCLLAKAHLKLFRYIHLNSFEFYTNNFSIKCK